MEEVWFRRGEGIIGEVFSVNKEQVMLFTEFAREVNRGRGLSAADPITVNTKFSKDSISSMFEEWARFSTLGHLDNDVRHKMLKDYSYELVEYYEFSARVYGHPIVQVFDDELKYRDLKFKDRSDLDSIVAFVHGTSSSGTKKKRKKKKVVEDKEDEAEGQDQEVVVEAIEKTEDVVGHEAIEEAGAKEMEHIKVEEKVTVSRSEKRNRSKEKDDEIERLQKLSEVNKKEISTLHKRISALEKEAKEIVEMAAKVEPLGKLDEKVKGDETELRATMKYLLKLSEERKSEILLLREKITALERDGAESAKEITKRVAESESLKKQNERVEEAGMKVRAEMEYLVREIAEQKMVREAENIVKDELVVLLRTSNERNDAKDAQIEELMKIINDTKAGELGREAAFGKFLDEKSIEFLFVVMKAKREVLDSLIPALNYFRRERLEIITTNAGEEKIKRVYENIYQQFLEKLSVLAPVDLVDHPLVEGVFLPSLNNRASDTEILRGIIEDERKNTEIERANSSKELEKEKKDRDRDRQTIVYLLDAYNELKNRFEQNAKILYFTNLDRSIGDEKLKELFSEFGTITSCKVMCYPSGTSRGSGFVAFSTAEEASCALAVMNGKVVVSKQLYVALAQRKKDRKAKLQEQVSQMKPLVAQDMAPGMSMYALGLGQPLYGQPLNPINTNQAGFGYEQQHVHAMRHAGGAPSNFLVPMVPQGQPLQHPGASWLMAQQNNPMASMPQQIVPQGSIHHFQSGRGSSHALPVMPGRMLSGPCTDASPERMPAGGLANAPLEQQTTMLGENLYQLVDELEHEHAAKVTGMLLEMDQTEILHLLERPDALKAKVTEAMEVLRNVATAAQQGNAAAEQMASLSINDH